MVHHGGVCETETFRSVGTIQRSYEKSSYSGL